MAGFDVIVIGAGIAGASLAAELAATHRVLLLEAEAHAGFHSTGRSAALFSEMYGNRVVRGLSRASRPTFFDPPADFAPGPLVSPRGVLFIASTAQLPAIDAFAALPDVASHSRRVDRAEALSLCPILRADYIASALYEPDARDVDVDGLHQAYLRRLRSSGGTTMLSSRVDRIERRSGQWQVGAGDFLFTAPVVVNAAGAWADLVGRLAGAPTIGLRPCRRTAVLVDPPNGVAIDRWPMVVDIEEGFYFKPDAGRLLLSPADETPSDPEDAQPDEWDVAVAIDRVMTAASLDVRYVRHKWAGLRSFVEDRTPVAGFEPTLPGFFWLAGQGGYGVQTAPAMGRLAAALVRGSDVPDDIQSFGISARDLAPERLQSAATATT